MSSAQALYLADTSTGSLTYVGDYTDGDMSDIAVAPDGSMYGVADSGDTFVRIDPGTAQTTYVGDTGEFINGLVVTPNGTIYGSGGGGFFSGGESIFTIDPNTGVATIVGDTDGFESAGDLAGGSPRPLFLGSDVLARVDEKTGEGTAIGSTQIPCLYGLADTPSGLFGGTCEGELIRIDPGSGEYSVIDDEGPGWFGMASAPWDGTGPPDANRSSLDYASGAPRLVPADGRSATTLLATVLDAAGSPLAGREVRVERIPETPRERRASRRARRLGLDDFSGTTNAKGKAWISITNTELGPHRFRLWDITTPTPWALGTPLKVEFTRKVVVLAMGFRSWSGVRGRRDYWGEPSDGSGPNANTVYSALRALGYRATIVGGDRSAPETIVDMSWEDAPCRPGLRTRACVATIRLPGTREVVRWDLAPYDIRRVAFSYWREMNVGRWAKKLVKTLETYDRRAFKATQVHTSFYLVGHSMGGQAVIRALDTALEPNSYFRGPEHRGMLPAVISVDGAANWGGFAHPLSKRPQGCPYWWQTVGNAWAERSNRRIIQDAHQYLSTQTIVITNTLDYLVLANVALINPRPKAGYRQYRYEGRAGDACAHSNLKRRQSGGITAIEGPASQFPLFDVVFRLWIREAAPPG
jgi:hypothetical protein